MLSPGDRFRLLRSVLRLANRLDDPEDPWQCVECDGPVELLGTGSVRELGWYFEGESTVPVSTFEEVCSFLLGCTYVRDDELFRVPDFWQHPLTFEQIRRGDCEDHALWAWRRLRELGYRAHLVTGSCSRDEVDPGAHAWVIFHGEGGLYLLEPTTKSREAMVRPLDLMRQLYQPHFSVDESLKLFLYGGWYVAQLSRRRARGLPGPPAGLRSAG